MTTMKKDTEAESNKLRQYSINVMMYGKYNVKMLQNTICMVNDMHERQIELEKQASGRAFGETKILVEKHEVWL